MIGEELKKIWKPGMVLVLIVLGFVFYKMFLEFYIEYFPNGPYAAGSFQIGVKMVQEYGTALSQEEMEQVKNSLTDLYEEVDRYIKEFDLAKKHGLESYEEYVNFCETSVRAIPEGMAADQNEDYADSKRIENYLTSNETENISGRIYATERFLRWYEAEQNIALDYKINEDYSVKENHHVKKTFYSENAAWQNIMLLEVMEATSRYLGYLLVWMCLSICLFHSPLLVHDRMSRMIALQYSSRRGRRIFLLQFVSVMLSAFLLTTLNLVIFGGIFMTNGTAVFFPCRMYSFTSISYCWSNWTYGTWCVMLVMLCYLVSMGTAAISFFLSQNSANYIVMLLKLIPLFVGMAILCLKLLERAFYFSNALYKMTNVPYVEMITAGIVFLAGVGLCDRVYCKIRKYMITEG